MELMLRRLSAVAGILSPIVLAVAAAFVAAQRPEYSHVRDALSELGAVGRPYARLMNATGIIPSGLLTIISAPAVYAHFGTGRLSRAAEIVLAVAGVGFIATAVFAWEGAPTDLSSTNNKLHLAFALSGFLCLAVAPLLFGLQARRRAGQRTRMLFSLSTALGVFVLGFILPRPPYMGLFQRGALLVFFVWLVAMCAASLWDEPVASGWMARIPATRLRRPK
jgi:hypothetical membrane protein